MYTEGAKNVKEVIIINSGVSKCNGRKSSNSEVSNLLFTDCIEQSPASSPRL